ncbi:MAG TPA: hypothetical protein VM911_21250 [Pyrinomonadaceae bacterium]|jgi:heme/copper-type cytochrome/quinol oxidase subunit 4|nr:hypothetical protein [Pyrinomonadaceae bacterium]
MGIESIAGITIVIALALIFLLFIVTRRLMRLVIRLALAGGLIVVAVVGGLVWWYGASDRDAGTNRSPKEKPSATRRANSR